MTIRLTILGLAVIGVAGAANAQTVDDVRQYAGGYSSLRVAPIAGQNAVQSIADLLSPGGVNTAIVPSDVLPYVRGDHRFHDADWPIGYTAKLDQEEVHILGRQDIRSIADLSGQKVNFDLHDSRAFITGSVLFQALHINVHPVSLDQHVALQLLRRAISLRSYTSGRLRRVSSLTLP